MNLKVIQQIDFSDLGKEYSLVVAACGYESRASHVVQGLSLQNVHASEKLVLAYKEHPKECSRPYNDEIFKQLGFNAVHCQGGAVTEVLATLASAFLRLPDEPNVHVLVDISSMTRAWYGSVIRTLLSIDRRNNLLVDFTYAAADFTEPPNDYPPNRVVAPIPGFTGNTLPDKPTALVLGLGYDKDRAIGLKDYLDPQLTVLFYADPAIDKRYTPRVLTVNAALMKEVPKAQTFTYQIDDCVATFKLLESVCNGLSHNWRVVLCSLGPKLFGLCCFLTASLLRDISIWRVSADSHEAPCDHRATGKPVVLETVWV